MKCDIVGCDTDAEYEDYTQNLYCESCMENAVSEDYDYEDFETIIQERVSE